MNDPSRIWAAYELAAPSRRAALMKARDMTVEQTVEVPAACVPAPSQPMVGTVDRVERAGPARWRVACSYHPAIVGDSVPQLFNLLFGNISMQQGIRLVEIQLPDALLHRLPGPAFGIEGLRQMCGVQTRPLVCAAAKPIGLSSAELARICYEFAGGGADIVKDDHGLAGQEAAPFGERVARCQEAVAEANERTGGRALYFPNLSRGAGALWEDLEYARSHGCRGVLLSPMLSGPDAVRAVAARREMAILSHPSFTGALLQRQHGIAPDVLFGLLFRVIGSDGVIYPNAGGRFPISLASCRAINQRLRAPLGRMRPAFPVAGGGVDAERVPYWIRQYGNDTMFLVGSSLYAQRDLRAATARLMDSIRRSSDG
jgi:ribulose-bisphosphate carboxylase large chain